MSRRCVGVVVFCRVDVRVAVVVIVVSVVDVVCIVVWWSALMLSHPIRLVWYKIRLCSPSRPGIATKCCRRGLGQSRGLRLRPRVGNVVKVLSALGRYRRESVPDYGSGFCAFPPVVCMVVPADPSSWRALPRVGLSLEVCRVSCFVPSPWFR